MAPYAMPECVPEVDLPAAIHAERLLGERGRTVHDLPGGGLPSERHAALATLLMDEFRRSGAGELFEALVELVRPQLLARVRHKLRSLGSSFDAAEVLQDAIINVYRYPAKFDASRPGAFAAWSTTIVDNAIRRQLRQRKVGVPIALSPSEALEQVACASASSPVDEASDHEEGERTAAAFSVLLQFYAVAFDLLSKTEREVLEMVEVRGLRYAEIAQRAHKRPEAIKMVVFRARRRIHERIAAWLSAALGRAPVAAA
jgi:RNA polymerase sigma-70 factor (ECF subfamily)